MRKVSLLVVDIETVPTEAYVAACMAETYPHGERAAPANYRDPEKIEAWMRADNRALDSLNVPQFEREIDLAVQCIAASGARESELLARSFGL